MIALHAIDGDHPHCEWQIVLIFGLGLIGRSILLELEHRKNYFARVLPFSWEGVRAQVFDLQAIIEYITSRFLPASRSKAASPSGRFDIVWSAGIGGFSSTEKQLESELRSFESVMGFASEIQELFPSACHSLHLISSGGGLFEGQCGVRLDSQPHPRRPYGELKLQQERLLDDLDQSILRFVYRPSSVYGFVTGGARFGLVTTLIGNGILRKVTRIFGNTHTLRDYLLSSDVGKFVGERICGSIREPGVFTLASGKPSSVLEVLRMTETLLDQNVYAAYQPSSANSAHNTFQPGALPEGWIPTDLYTGMQLTKLQLLDFFAQSKFHRKA